MPTIDTRKAKDGTISYRVRVQKKGYPTQTATFPTLRDARRWGAMVEGQIVEHRHFPTKDAHTLSDLITRYADDVLPRKRPETQRREAYILAFWRQRLGQKLLTDITKSDIVKVRDEFSKRGAKSTTVHRYLNLLSHVLNTAIRDYDWIEHNVVSMVSKPSLPPGRTRYLSDQERCRLLQECRKSKNSHLYLLVVLGLYTGMRRGNLLELRKRDVNLAHKTISVAQTKNGTALVLPLVGEAYELVAERCSHIRDEQHLFPHTPGTQPRHWYRRAFNEAMKRAGITDASFHTLRHSTASYLIQSGVDIYIVSRILSHRNIATTTRYAHLSTDTLKNALETMTNRLF